MRKHLTTLAALLMASSAALGGDESIRFWNLTETTIINLQFSPAGQNAWGSNQCKNVKEGKVDYDERLTLNGVVPGLYDMKVQERGGRECVVKSIDVKASGMITLNEVVLSGSCPR